MTRPSQYIPLSSATATPKAGAVVVTPAELNEWMKGTVVDDGDGDGDGSGCGSSADVSGSGVGSGGGASDAKEIQKDGQHGELMMEEPKNGEGGGCADAAAAGDERAGDGGRDASASDEQHAAAPAQGDKEASFADRVQKDPPTGGTFDICVDVDGADENNMNENKSGDDANVEALLGRKKNLNVLIGALRAAADDIHQQHHRKQGSRNIPQQPPKKPPLCDDSPAPLKKMESILPGKGDEDAAKTTPAFMVATMINDDDGKDGDDGAAGETPADWRSAKGDLPARRVMVRYIAALLEFRRRSDGSSPPTVQWMSDLPHKSKMLEERLYLTAPSLERYLDRREIKARLGAAARDIAVQHSNEEMTKKRRRSSRDFGVTAASSSVGGRGGKKAKRSAIGGAVGSGRGRARVHPPSFGVVVGTGNASGAASKHSFASGGRFDSVGEQILRNIREQKQQLLLSLGHGGRSGTSPATASSGRLRQHP